MDKPYDFKDLAERMKKDGIELAEDAAIKVVKNLSAWVQESAKLSPTPLDDIAATVLPYIESKAVEALDKMDGKVG